MVYDTEVFGDSVSLDGLACAQDKCLITAIPNDKGKQQATSEALPIFVAKWREKYPKYKSPYETSSTARKLSGNETAEELGRIL